MKQMEQSAGSHQVCRLFLGLKASLERLQLDYVDVVFANRPDPNTPMEGNRRVASIPVQLFQFLTYSHTNLFFFFSYCMYKITPLSCLYDYWNMKTIQWELKCLFLNARVVLLLPPPHGKNEER